ncbi:MAG TPA: HAD family phosphatase [Candidatus Thermoplasmatota archaeon]|nr:HAD family phosphatase [Candidatus Thermoplasmatota archaeon]
MIRAFCFDLDETLVDAEPQHERATRAMLETLGHRPDTQGPSEDMTGARTSDIVEAYRAKLGAPQSTDEMLALRHTAFLAALDADPPQPLPGARELVAACRARGPCALVTSGYRDDAIETLRAVGFLGAFATIVTGDDVLEPKPSPEPYKLAAARLGFPPDDILVFEDSPRGVAAAKAAGCRVVAVPNARSTSPAAVADADVVLESLEQALPLDALLGRLL